MVRESYMLTTKDNPYNPFKDFTSWLLYDKEKGYDTCDYLARIATPSNAFSEEENNQELEDAIDSIIQEDVLGIYVKVSESNYDKVFDDLNKIDYGDDELISLP